MAFFALGPNLAICWQALTRSASFFVAIHVVVPLIREGVE
jgi:hypothetical protein